MTLLGGMTFEEWIEQADWLMGLRGYTMADLKAMTEAEFVAAFEAAMDHQETIVHAQGRFF